MAVLVEESSVPLSAFDRWLVAVKRRETPAASLAHDAYRFLHDLHLPDVRPVRFAYRTLGLAYDAYVDGRELLLAKMLWEPMLRARCQGMGRRVSVLNAPYVRGHVRIRIGDDCYFSSFTVESGRFKDQPQLHIGSHCHVGYGTLFSVNDRVTIGDHVGISQRVAIQDSDGHPSDVLRRVRGESLGEKDLAPVTIHDYAWVGRDAHVLKGVTIGAGAIVASGSVVAGDIPDGAVAMGVPARVIRPAS